MDAFVITWLYTFGFILVAFLGINMAVYFNKNVDSEIKDKYKSRMYWVKSICVIFGISVVGAACFTIIEKIGIIGIIILIGIPGALISMIGKK